MGKSLSALWREPLVHFLLIGAVVFGLHSWLIAGRAESNRTISISTAQMQRLASVWEVETGREPTAQDMEGLLADYVREEVLYREALRLGLDRGDTIIRRRLAQKLGFLLAREDELALLEDDDLRAAFEADPQVYARPDRVNLLHVPYNFSRDGTDRSGEIARDLTALSAGPQGGVVASELGDPFLLAREHRQVSQAELARLFGRDFATVVFAQSDTGWVGPIRSRLADHLVQIQERVPGGVPAFEDIVEDIRAREAERQKRQADEAAWLELRKQYVIKMNDGP